MKYTKKYLKENTLTSIDCFGKNHFIDVEGLYASRLSLRPEIEILFGNKKMIATMGGSSKKEFVDKVYEYIQK